MYWLCLDDTTGTAAIIYSPVSPDETSNAWDAAYSYDSEREAVEAMREWRDERDAELDNLPTWDGMLDDYYGL